MLEEGRNGWLEQQFFARGLECQRKFDVHTAPTHKVNLPKAWVSSVALVFLALCLAYLYYP